MLNPVSLPSRMGSGS